MPKQAMRKFDETCRPPVAEMTPAEIHKARLCKCANQAQFAPLAQRNHTTDQPARAQTEASAFPAVHLDLVHGLTFEGR